MAFIEIVGSVLIAVILLTAFWEKHPILTFIGTMTIEMFWLGLFEGFY